VSLGRCDLPTPADRAEAEGSWPPVLAADVAVVVVFALLGRLSHDEGNLLTGTLGTAAPFVLGLLSGWLRAPCAGLSAAQRSRTTRFGWWLLAWTMAGGAVLRWLGGDGLAPAFLAVATLVLGVGLVGRRWVVERWLVRRRWARQPQPR